MPRWAARICFWAAILLIVFVCAAVVFVFVLGRLGKARSQVPVLAAALWQEINANGPIPTSGAEVATRRRAFFERIEGRTGLFLRNKDGEVADVWGTPFLVKIRRPAFEGGEWTVEVRGAGRDGYFGTMDDLFATRGGGQ